MHHQNLWAPWRISYLKGLDHAGAQASAGSTPAQHAVHPQPKGHAPDDRCFLCDAADPHLTYDQRAQRLVLCRHDHGILLLNRYPYTNGHLMVAPPEHIAELDEMTPDQRAGLMELAALAQRLLRATMNPHGLNLGMNLGRCAGAGVPGHAHLHVVPRWHGDVNFMDAVAGVRVIPEALARTYDQFRAALDQGIE